MAKRYIDVVNAAIEESGANLDQFATDGSDWTTTFGRDPLMFKFKTWVARAWQTIQQEAYDWDFMSEQAVANLAPGFMFYSPHKIDWTYPDANPLTIYDTDDTPRVTQQTLIRQGTLTGVSTDQLNYGWVELDSSNTAPITFTLKTGGEYFLAEVPMNVTVTSDSAGFTFDPAVGTSIGAVQVILNDTDLGTTPETVATVTANAVGNGVAVATFQVLNPATRGNIQLITSFQATTPNVDWTINLYDTVNGTLLQTISSIDNSILLGLTSDLTPATYPVIGQFYGSGVTLQNGGPSVGTEIATVTIQGIDFPNAGVVTFINGTYIEFEITNSAIYDAFFLVQKTADTYSFQLKDGSHTILVDIERGTVGESVDLAAFNNRFIDLDSRQNFIHSWKSYDWSEEIQDNDFVEEVSEIDQQSFRISYYEDPTPATEIKLSFIPWETFRIRFDNANQPPGQPRIVTEDNTGRWKFYPALDRPYTMMFDYVRNPQQVVDFDDTFKKIPDDILDVVMWRALIYYGEYDEQPSVVQRATRNYKDLLFRMELRFREKFHFKSGFTWGGWV